ncbi:Neural/ectodermal development factor IMP-L2 [Penaeus vannamei]|uniref:Neural/ectodermal development factor IMP-L2 n=1 Tax=Penaeus vannamei TaxID=6689 RepID=A0A423STD3_PENVA|nr:Neural/ectodermal development factor IMP-L2 [Penaeus vannamei]
MGPGGWMLEPTSHKAPFPPGRSPTRKTGPLLTLKSAEKRWLLELRSSGRQELWTPHDAPPFKPRFESGLEVVTGFDWGLKGGAPPGPRSSFHRRSWLRQHCFFLSLLTRKELTMIHIFLMAVVLVVMAPCEWSVQGSSLHVPSDMQLQLPKIIFGLASKKKQTKRSEAVREEERDEVLWTSECSPRVAGVRRGQDARLQCEMVAPTGSVLTWFKDDVPLHREGETAEGISMPREFLEEATNMLGLEEEELPSTISASASVVQVSSVVYLDCVSDQHQATYKLEVRPPRSQKSYSRLFTVVIVGDESEALEEGPTCRLGALVNALPRIYQHSPAAMGHAGDSVTLPCRSQGHNVTREWFLNDERISSDANYRISGNGDLLVRRLSAQAHTQYTCRVISTRFSALSDTIFTVVNGNYVMIFDSTLNATTKALRGRRRHVNCSLML